MTEARDEVPPPRPGAPIEIDPRITWAAERTFLAWIRTGIAFMGFGFVVARFGFFLRELVQQGGNAPQTHINATRIGVAMVAFGVLINVAATLRHRRVVQRLLRGAPIVPETGFPAAVALGSALMGAVEVGLLIAALLR